MPLVLDASATLACCLRDEATVWSFALLERMHNGDTAHVPAHWLTEVGNGLLVAVRRNRLELKEAIGILDDLEQLPLHIEPITSVHSLNVILRSAAQHTLTVYDASYLALADRLQYPLATLDKELLVAATSLGIPLI